MSKPNVRKPSNLIKKRPKLLKPTKINLKHNESITRFILRTNILIKAKTTKKVNIKKTTKKDDHRKETKTIKIED